MPLWPRGETYRSHLGGKELRKAHSPKDFPNLTGKKEDLRVQPPVSRWCGVKSRIVVQAEVFGEKEKEECLEKTAATKKIFTVLLSQVFRVSKQSRVGENNNNNNNHENENKIIIINALPPVFLSILFSLLSLSPNHYFTLPT